MYLPQTETVKALYEGGHLCGIKPAYLKIFDYAVKTQAEFTVRSAQRELKMSISDALASANKLLEKEFLMLTRPAKGKRSDPRTYILNTKHIEDLLEN